ncbi:hypothetical protein BS47DRAFT_1341011 [Hydnum rufescens UP504]|uniref:Uncharacterized protein n=1 Tax=Hydnum rufescens UP504 TaxID=1448309 RepID=A0A9P6B3N6_9AGAM|nr:hypothetical protein BS47DRAFT_1341011 [Hydnum rufescens UP504]
MSNTLTFINGITHIKLTSVGYDGVEMSGNELAIYIKLPRQSKPFLPLYALRLVLLMPFIRIIVPH